MARTPLFAALRRAAGIAAAAQAPGAPPADELAAMPLRRRALLAAAATAPLPLRAEAAQRARIAIVGAGLAGLVAAHRLVAAGMRDVTLYEANRRSGGRVLTGRGTLGEGSLVELGGSFINTEHADMLALAGEFALPLEDSTEDATAARIHIEGAARSIAAIAAEAAPLVARLAALRAGGEATKAAQDGRSAAALLDELQISGWLRKLLDIGLTQEMGQEPGAMSALYLIEYFAPDPAAPRRGLFSSDQRYQIAGGNDRLTAALSARLAARIRTGMRLESLRPQGRGYALGFAAREVAADAVILALPATMLRQVAIAAPLPLLTRRAIRELGYGSNAKLFAGVSARPWRAEGLSGETISDLGPQTSWEDHATPGSGRGSLTLFAGGATGRGFGAGDPAALVRAATAALTPALPGIAAAFDGRASRMHWPGNPYVGGSYACFAPGQYAGFAAAWAPAGRLVFAGEHTSEAHSGYMNGAAESGRIAAEQVLAQLR
jgi:monoamine oxidase